ncbi:MAG: diguanylate cyclase domain-containing protein [Enterovibrio sp.]
MTQIGLIRSAFGTFGSSVFVPFLFLLSLAVASAPVALAQGAAAPEASTEHMYVLKLPPNKKVLYINSFHRGLPWSDAIEQGMRDALMLSQEPVDFSVVYLDALRFPNNKIQKKMAELLALNKLAESADLILTSHNAAFDFANTLQNQKKAAPDSAKPIIFTALSKQALEESSLQPNVAGITEFDDFAATVQKVLSLHPQTKQLLFISDPFNQHSQHLFEKMKKDVLPRLARSLNVDFVFVTKKQELQQALELLGPDALLFMLAERLPNENRYYLSANQTISMVNELTTAPIYSFWLTHIGYGSVGGQVISGHAQGRAAAKLALKVLSLSDRNQLPQISDENLGWYFDRALLAQYKVAPQALPEGARFVNSKKSLWVTYQMQILMGAALLFAAICLVLLIALFSLRKKNQQKALEGLQEEAVPLTDPLDPNLLGAGMPVALANDENLDPLDPLTGLFNAAAFEQKLSKELLRAYRYRTSLSLLLFSVDEWPQKLASGDAPEKLNENLISLSKWLSTDCGVRGTDILAYLQDAKFALLLPHTNNTHALQIAEKLLNGITNVSVGQGSSSKLTMSIGVASVEGLRNYLVSAQHMLNTSEMLRVTAEHEGGTLIKSQKIVP